jgi:hypothetical protein
MCISLEQKARGGVEIQTPWLETTIPQPATRRYQEEYKEHTNHRSWVEFDGFMSRG